MPLPVRMLGSMSTCQSLRCEPVPSQIAASKLGPNGDGNSIAATLGLKDVRLVTISVALSWCCTVHLRPIELREGLRERALGLKAQGKLPEVATHDGHRYDRLGHRVGLRVGVSIDCQSGVVLRRAESCIQEQRHHQVVKATSDIAVPVLVARQDDDHLVVVGEVPELGEGLDVKGQRTDDVGQCQGCGANRSSERLGLIMSRSWPAHAGLPCLVYTTERAMSNVKAATWPPVTPTARKLTATSPVLAVAVAERLATLRVAGEAAASTCHWSLVPWCHSSVDKEPSLMVPETLVSPRREANSVLGQLTISRPPPATQLDNNETCPRPNADACEKMSCRAARNLHARLIVCCLGLQYTKSARVSFSQVATPCWRNYTTDTLLELACLCGGHGLYVSKNGHIGRHEVRAGHSRNVLVREQVEALGTQDLAKVAAELVGEASPVLKLSSVARAARLRLREEVLLEIVKMYVQLRTRVVLGCQVAPPLVDTSMAPIWVALASEPGSFALPLIKTEAPCAKEDPECGVVVVVAEATAVFLHNRNRLALTGTCTTSMTFKVSHKYSLYLCQIQTCKDDKNVREHLRSEEAAMNQ
eukprot:SM000019S05143  [mRNA]  locus=s19:1140149:1149671:- [translate_table: standard]